MRGTAAGHESPQGSFKIPHEQRVDYRVHGAVTVAEPSDGVEQGRRHAFTHSLNKTIHKGHHEEQEQGQYVE